jgi:hypothetical protein
MTNVKTARSTKENEHDMTYENTWSNRKRNRPTIDFNLRVANTFELQPWHKYKHRNDRHKTIRWNTNPCRHWIKTHVRMLNVNTERSSFSTILHWTMYSSLVIIEKMFQDIYLFMLDFFRCWPINKHDRIFDGSCENKTSLLTIVDSREHPLWKNRRWNCRRGKRK